MDTLGLVMRVVVHPANLSDPVGAKQVLAPLAQDWPTVTRVWADMGYRGDVAAWLAQETGCTLAVVARPAKRGWVRAAATAPEASAESGPPATAPGGFTLLPRRWVVERTFGWFGRFRRLSKDYEGLPVTEEAWIYLAMSHVMVRRLAA